MFVRPQGQFQRRRGQRWLPRLPVERIVQASSICCRSDPWVRRPAQVTGGSPRPSCVRRSAARFGAHAFEPGTGPPTADTPGWGRGSTRPGVQAHGSKSVWLISAAPAPTTFRRGLTFMHASGVDGSASSAGRRQGSTPAPAGSLQPAEAVAAQARPPQRLMTRSPGPAPPQPEQSAPTRRRPRRVMISRPRYRAIHRFG